MSVREYIGARYVPIFADPLAWDSSRTYEPLTIVQHAGNSYTSRQYVPAGIDIANEAFWALTGNYNAQIEQYRQEVRTFDGRISTNESDIATLNGRVTDINDTLSEAITELTANVADLNNDLANFTDVEDLGIASNFRYAMRPPATFDVDAFLNAARADMADFAAYDWTYAYDTANATIPLLTNSPNYAVLNAGGSHVSCSTLVGDALYKAGYTELEGPAKYMTGPTGRAMQPFLESKGWIYIHDQDSLRAGDIVCTGWRRDSNDLMFPAHTYIYAGNNMAYDAGSQAKLAQGGLSQVSWNDQLDQFYRLFESGFYYCHGDINLQYTDNPENLLDWSLINIVNIGYVANLNRNGYHITQIFTCDRRTIIRQTKDNAINWTEYSTERIQDAEYLAYNATNETLESGSAGNYLAFSAQANPNEQLYRLESDGTVTINFTGRYSINMLIRERFDGIDQSALDALSNPTINARVFLVARDGTIGSSPILEASAPYTKGWNTLFAQRTVRLLKGQGIKVNFQYPSRVSSKEPTIANSVYETHIGLELL